MRSRSHNSNVISDTRGASIVEFAVIAPLYFTLFLGTIGWSLTMMTINGVQFASEQAARCKIVTDCLAIQLNRTYNDPISQRISWLPGLDTSDYTLSQTPAVSTSPTAYCVTVKVENKFINGFASIPDFLTKSYCRSTQILN